MFHMSAIKSFTIKVYCKVWSVKKKDYIAQFGEVRLQIQNTRSTSVSTKFKYICTDLGG